MNTCKSSFVGLVFVDVVDAMNRSLVVVGEQAHFDGIFDGVNTHLGEIKHQLDCGTFLEQFDAQVLNVIAAAKTGSKCRFNTQMRRLDAIINEHQMRTKVEPELLELGTHCVQLLADAKKVLVVANC